MGLTTKTSQWADSLWHGHCASSPHAAAMVRTGKTLQPRFLGFCEDVHAALYLPCDSTPKKTAPDWAVDLLRQAKGLAEWQPLRQRCARNGFAAGVATETILDALLPHVPKATDQERQRGQSLAGAGNDPAGDTRRMLRHAMRAAGKELDQAEAACEALGAALGMPGDADGTPETLQDIARIRSLWALLRDNPTLRHIADMAGRLSRLGAVHKRSELRPGVGAITGVTLGGDLASVLPSELAGLRSPNRMQRLATMGALLGKKALQYEQHAREPLAKGPILLCLDESGSMKGEPEQWSKAIALTLLASAQQQGRAFWICGFTRMVTHETLCQKGESTIAMVLEMARMRADGGTRFDPPLLRALDVLAHEPVMRHADLIFVTDGKPSVEPAATRAVLDAKARHGLHIYTIGIGGDVDTLAPIADAQYSVSNNPESDSPMIATVLAATA